MSLLKRIHDYAEAAIGSAVISVISLRALEPVIEAIRPEKICDLVSHPWGSSIVGAFAGVAIGNCEENDHSARYGVHVGVPTVVGIMAGTAAPSSISALSGAFAAAWLGLYLRRHVEVPERVTTYDDLDY